MYVCIEPLALHLEFLPKHLALDRIFFVNNQTHSSVVCKQDIKEKGHSRIYCDVWTKQVDFGPTLFWGEGGY